MVSHTQKDEVIIQLLQNKNRQAISEIYDKYGSALYGVILRMVSSKKLAEEVLEKTLLQVWQNALNYNPSQEKLFNWLLHICRKVSFETLQSKKKQAVPNPLNTYSNLEENIREEILLHGDDLKKVVQQLDKRYSSLIDLVYFQGYTSQQVGKILKIPVESVNLQTKLATQKLRSVLQPALL